MPQTNADLIAQELRQAGIREVFGQPGGEVVGLIEALAQHKVAFQLTGHESAAAFMAGALGRLSGTPGVCLATLGPGACNLALGVAAAWLDRDPLLAISGLTATDRARWSNKQNLPLTEMFTPITKWSAALSAAHTGAVVRDALALAAAPPHGPVYVGLPTDVASARPADGPRPTPPVPAPASDEALERIIASLNAAAYPIAVIGPALNAREDSLAVRACLARLGIPHVSVPQGKGIADEMSPWHLGTVAPGAGDALLGEWLSRSDCLLGIGFDPVESSQDWHLQRVVCSLSTYPVGFRDWQPTHACIGPLPPLLEAVGRSYRGQPRWAAAEARTVRQAVSAAITPEAAATRMGLSPYHVVRALREALPADSIVTTDVGAHKMLLAQAWFAPGPLQFLVSNGLSAMGYGLPAALAAAHLHPDRPIAAILGDGGFAMMVQEMETAHRLNVRPLVVVLCDRALAVIKVAQTIQGLPWRGVNLAPVDWARVAEGFGCQAAAIHSLSHLERAVAAWLARPELTVLAVSIDDALYRGLNY